MESDNIIRVVIEFDGNKFFVNRESDGSVDGTFTPATKVTAKDPMNQTPSAREDNQERLRELWTSVQMTAELNLLRLSFLRLQGKDCQKRHLRAVSNLSSLLQARGEYLISSWRGTD